MSPRNKEINSRCIELCQGYVKAEPQIIAQLQLVQKFKIYKEVGKKNIFLYALEVCGLSSGQAYVFTSLAKKSAALPALNSAIEQEILSVSKANRIASIINEENSEELIDFARKHSVREIEREVRRRNPRATERAAIKPLDEDTDLLHTPIARETTELIRRAQAILAQKNMKHQDLAETNYLVYKDFVDRYDPVLKAERIAKKKARKAESYPHFSARAEKSRNDEPLTAAQKQAVDLRDRRKCTHIHNGQRCNDDRWIHYHHIIPRSSGGSNDLDNLTTLCSFHHDLVHQLEFPMEGTENMVGKFH